MSNYDPHDPLVLVAKAILERETIAEESYVRLPSASIKTLEQAMKELERMVSSLKRGDDYDAARLNRVISSLSEVKKEGDSPSNLFFSKKDFDDRVAKGLWKG